MTRRLLAVAFAGALVLGACGGDDADGGASATTAASKESGAAPARGAAASNMEAIENAEDCDALIAASTPVFTRLFQQLVDETGDLSVTELAKMGEDPEGHPLFQRWAEELQEEVEAIEAKVDDLGCSPDDAQIALCDAVSGVKGDNVIAEAMIEGMAEDC